MTTITLSLDEDRKAFDLDDGPAFVHAGETVKLVLRGLGIDADKANGISIPEGTVDEEDGSDLAAAYPYLRARIVHPVFGDLAMYPWPASPPKWDDEDGGALSCQIDLDTEQLFRVVRSGHGDELMLYVETPWPESVPTVYGTYPIRVADWPEATGEIRVFPATGRYANALAGILSLNALERDASLNDTMDHVNVILAALKKLAKRDGNSEPEEEEAEE